MTTIQDYRQLIVQGIEGLSPETLTEIVDFIYFVRKRALQPEAFGEELKNSLLRTELQELSRDEAAHLEAEFTDYDHLYPID